MAESSHKRDTNARRLPRPSVLAGSVAALATLSVVSVGVLTSSPAASVLMADDPADTGSGQVVAAPEVELAADRGLAPLSHPTPGNRRRAATNSRPMQCSCVPESPPNAPVL